MRLRNFFSPLALVIALIACENQHNAADASQSRNEDDWQTLFEDNTLDGWRAAKTDSLPDKAWKLQDGILTGSGKGGDIVTEKQYGNFELQWEWKMLTKGGNSGVKYFVSNYGTDGKKEWLGLEYQLLDDENFPWMNDGRMKAGDYRTVAALYELYPAEHKKSKPVGEWNTSRIVANGNHIEHWLNGEMVIQCERGSDDFRERVRQSKFATHEKFGEADKGHILIQDHGSEMQFRNMRIRNL